MISMEKFFISEFSDWDRTDSFGICFLNAKLIIDIPPYKNGDIVKYFDINMETSTISIYGTINGEDVDVSYNVGLSLKEKV